MNGSNLGCGINESTIINQTYTNYQLPFFPMSNDTLRALVVFVNFADGNFDPAINQPIIPNYVYLNYWPGSYPEYLTKPSWADSVICSTTTNVWDRSLTALYRDASRGKFWLIWDVYPSLVVVNNISSYVGRGLGTVVKDVIEQISPNVNWSNYDKFSPFTYGDRHQPDSIIDFIFILFRFNNSGSIEGTSFSGICGLGGYYGNFGRDSLNQLISELPVGGNKKILAQILGSGCISDIYSPWHMGYASHEFGQHYGYDRYHSETMGSYNINGGNVASAADREYFGWSSSPTYAPTSNTTITLRDYVTTNDYVRIQRSNEYIFLENRRRFNYFSSENYKIWKWKNFEPLKPVQSDSILVIYRRFSDISFDIQSANGNWDWQMCNNSYKTKYYSNTFNFFFPDKPNRFYGTSTFLLHEIPVADSNCQNYPFLGSYMGSLGDSNTCFDIDYNEVYSPWSNPPLPVNNPNDSLTIEIAGKDINGNLIINVYFTNILAAKPSKPQGLQLNYTECLNGKIFPVLTWNHNLEPDMIVPWQPPFDYKRYRIFRAVSDINGILGNYNQIYDSYFRVDQTPTYTDYNAYIECGIPGVPPSYLIAYKIKAIDNTLKESVFSDFVSTFVTLYQKPRNGPEEISNLPKVYNLYQNYPNPFNPVTKINFDLPKDSKVSLVIYDILGREIANLINGEMKPAGRYLIDFNGNNLASGVYFYRIQAGDFVSVKRMVLIK